MKKLFIFFIFIQIFSVSSLKSQTGQSGGSFFYRNVIQYSIDPNTSNAIVLVELFVSSPSINNQSASSFEITAISWPDLQVIPMHSITYGPYDGTGFAYRGHDMGFTSTHQKKFLIWLPSTEKVVEGNTTTYNWIGWGRTGILGSGNYNSGMSTFVLFNNSSTGTGGATLFPIISPYVVNN